MIQADTKTQKSHLPRIFHETLRKAKLRATPDKTFFLLASVKLFGHVVAKNKIRLILNIIEAILQTKRPEPRKGVMKLLGALNYYSKHVLNMHVILAPLYALSHYDASFH